MNSNMLVVRLVYSGLKLYILIQDIAKFWLNIRVTSGVKMQYAWSWNRYDSHEKQYQLHICGLYLTHADWKQLNSISPVIIRVKYSQRP